MGKKTESLKVEEIHTTKYFSAIVDSTPDLSHTGQLTIIIRLVQPNGKPIERIWNLLNLMVMGLREWLTKFWKLLCIWIFKSATVTDNAANMAGIYTGLQARILKLNRLAVFVPCAVESSLIATNFFGFVQLLYNFSQHQLTDGQNWKILCQVVDSFWKHRKLVGVLEPKQPIRYSRGIKKLKIYYLISKMTRMKTILTVIIWHKMNRFNATTKSLQDPNIFINPCWIQFPICVKHTMN